MEPIKEIKVAIVEDNHIIREGLVDLFEKREGFRCQNSYSNAEDAIADKSLTDCHVVLMDINLPGISGIDAITQMKNRKQEQLFMILTVYDEDDKVFQALKAGASGYLLKSASPEEILSAVHELSEGGSPMSTVIARKVVNAFHSDKQNSPHFAVLSPREKEVLDLLSKGLMYREIAEQLFISIGTVKQHANKIYEKLHVSNRTQAINKMYN